MNCLTLVLVAASSALCTWFSAEPVGSGIATFIAPLLLICIALHARQSKQIYIILFLTQMPVWLILHSWIIPVAFLGWFFLAMYMSIWAPLFVFILQRVQVIPRISVVVSAPILWVGLECLRGIVLFDGYPWYLVGTGVIDWELASIASLGGVWLISYLVLTVSALLATVKQARWWTILIVALICYDTTVRDHGLLFKRPLLFSPSTTIAIIQTNVPQSNKVSWSWEKQVEDVTSAMEITVDAIEVAEVQPALIVWPETMVPGSGFEVRRSDFEPWDDVFKPFWYWSEQVKLLARDLQIPILVGSQTWIDVQVEEGDKYLSVNQEEQFNSAVLVKPDGTTQRYDKSFLTPFGERIPYVEKLDIVKEWVRATFGAAMLFDLKPGYEVNRFAVPAQYENGETTTISFATPICFEDTVPSVIRNLVWEHGERKASLLINLSNDGWFGADVSAHWQHVREARMRCIENRTPMIRVANTGISCVIDSRGKVYSQLPLLAQASMIVDVYGSNNYPLSRFVGDKVAWFALSCSILLILFSMPSWSTKEK